MTMSDARQGYSAEVVRRVQGLDPALPVARFARYCVANEIPVMTVADKFKVSRETVYNWFTGVYTPRPRHVARMLAILDSAGA